MAPLTRLKPDHDEQHITEILRIIPRGGICIEGGAHRGLWTVKLQEHFDHVFAFEANSEHVLELSKIVNHARVSAYCMALADKCRYWGFEQQPGATNDGQYRIVDAERGKCIFSARIDDQHWQEVSFIKLDIEGSEHLAILGGINTIMRCKPFVMIEQNELSEVNFNVPKDHAANLLLELGMNEIARWNKDILFGWLS